MKKSFVDKIPTSPGWWVYGCRCCMKPKDKPMLRRNLRKKLKAMLKKKLKEPTNE